MCIQSYLKSLRIQFEPMLHAPATTASRRAHFARTPGRCVAKGVLVKAGDAFLLAVLPSTARIDFQKLSHVLCGAQVTLATEDQSQLIFGDCQRGALPPFGSLYGIRTILDSGLDQNSEIVCVGNQRHEGIRIGFRDYLAIEKPIRASFAIAIPSIEKSPRRQAG